MDYALKRGALNISVDSSDVWEEKDISRPSVYEMFFSSVFAKQKQLQSKR